MRSGVVAGGDYEQNVSRVVVAVLFPEGVRDL